MHDSYWSESVPKTLELLDARRDGFQSEEAAKRLQTFGPNVLPEPKRVGGFEILLSQFTSPLIYLLVAAAGVSLVLGERIDALVIIAAVGINTIVGFLQEYRASRALEALRALLSPRARVLRAGNEIDISASELVPGDVIVLAAGDRVPADARVTEAYDLRTTEAPLTGESASVSKTVEAVPIGAALAERRSMVYAGTTVARGRGLAAVTATGALTQLGKIAALARGVPEPRTPLQHRLTRLSHWIGAIAVSVAAVLFIAGIATGQGFAEMFLLSVAIAVAAIPEGLLISVTVILAIGMRRILREQAIVRRLVAAETLGSVSAICTDKTGTLTEGEMRVAHIWSGEREVMGEAQIRAYQEEQEEAGHATALHIGLLCNDAAISNPDAPLEEWKAIGDPTEVALLLAAIQAGMDHDEHRRRYPRLDEIPFDAEHKEMVTLHATPVGERIVYVKGAPEVLLAQSTALARDGASVALTDANKKEVRAQIERLAVLGLRLLAVGYKSAPLSLTKLAPEAVGDFVFVGIIGLKDPLRSSVAETLQNTRAAGIRPVIVTGDHRRTAELIAQELGFPGGAAAVVDGTELARMNDDELRAAVHRVEVFARVEPAQKVRIVSALRESREVVAFVGDGVNDAPALRAADVGVALASGTDVAKETADIVLLDNNFKTIVRAVEQGRVMFDNIRKVVLYLLGGSFSEILVVAGSLLFGLPLPLLAAQILWVNLIEDTFPNIALAFDPGEPGIMRRRPRPKGEALLDREMKTLVGIIAVFTNILLFALFLYYWRTTGDIAFTRTIVFAGLAIDSLFYVYACRNLRENIWQSNPFRNRLLNGAVLLGIALLAAAVYFPPLQHILRTVPLGAREWTVLFGLGIVDVLLIEVTKLVFVFRREKVERSA